MRKLLIYLLPILTPLLIVVAVNEWCRSQIGGGNNAYMGYPTINTVLKISAQCSWYCHNNTTYCKQVHTHVLKPWFKQIDPFYFGMVSYLKSTGDYAAANIFFLVLLWPIVMYWLLIRILLRERVIRERVIRRNVILGIMPVALVNIGVFIYSYCTDFIINAANLIGLSYYEINAIIFCMLWPLVAMVLIVINLIQLKNNFILKP